MRSFDQLAKAAYDAWHQSHGTDKHQVPFEQLDATYRVHWISVAQALATELSSVH